MISTVAGTDIEAPTVRPVIALPDTTTLPLGSSAILLLTVCPAAMATLTVDEL